MKYTTYAVALLGFALAPSAWCACLDTGESGVQLQVLGSGGPGASGGRASASYLLWVDGIGRILVDAGSGTKDQFHRAGGNFDDIELVALSHLHPDHAAELPAILWPAGGRFSLSGPSAGGVFPSIEAFVDRLFGPNGAFRILADRIEVEAITVDVSGTGAVEVWDDGAVAVRGTGVPHGDVPTVGYRIDFGDVSIAFASDQNGSDPAFVDFIRDVDVLVIHLAGTEESTGMIAQLHARPSVWGQMASTANAARVVVSHISTSSAQVLDASLAILREHYSGPVTVAEDLMCVDIG